ncbi:rod shape-determining protein MreD [Sphingomonas japonica]|uniref:Rod shape-determining protein MreD n=1 Tax=Sphingomonas japonica TaxID=511662 RepID=A0ABX0U7K6_9SPHN|nr:rod shape-determining protein MreD [Sphingomonas japonica]NIJ24753.1 rod shape-determining protein MreD [Sphingomonas japonica]
MSVDTLATPAPPRTRTRWVAPLSVMLGSLITLVPVVATIPVLPPFGLLMLMGWRLHRPDIFRTWACVPLGLFDDLVSGQPLGSATMLWTLCFLAVDVIDTRLVWRDFKQDWLVAAGAIGFALIGGRLIAVPLGAHVDTLLMLQALASVALYPLVTRMCAGLDRRSDRL